jgi:hypothetical protein
MQLAQAGHVEAKQALEQQLMAVLTGKVRPSTKWSTIGWCQAQSLVQPLEMKCRFTFLSP